MKPRTGIALPAAALLLVGCISLRPTLPEPAAAAAADRYIADTWRLPSPPPAERPRGRFVAQGPQIEYRRTQMELRYVELERALDAGQVGLDAEGYVALRTPEALDAETRARLRALVANENSDRAALYEALAELNGHPRWRADIRRVYAGRWQARARSGWWLQDGEGRWQQQPE